MSGIKNNLQHNTTVQSNTAFLQELRNKLPQYFTAEKTEIIERDDGQSETKIIQKAEFNTEKFLADLAQNNISESRDGYRLSFVGKDYARLQTGMASETVIVPDIEHNQKDENKKSQNVFITGDNLETLRHLQNTYANQIKMIYIDPPYNTGKEFVYNDQFEFSDEKLKNQLGYTDEEVARLKSIQGKSSHSAWLTFMYPRLKIAQKLLRDDGVIFVSIDDNEQANLKLLMDDVFGEGNFITTFMWKRKKEISSDSKDVSFQGEYILCYGRSLSTNLKLESLSEDYIKDSYYDANDEFSLGKWRPVPITVSKGLNGGGYEYEIQAPNGTKHNRLWAYPQKSYIELVKLKRVYFGKNGSSIPQRIIYAHESSGQPTTNYWEDIATNKQGKKEILNLFGDNFFDTPKPTALIKKIINFSIEHNDIILDFFAGSGTTADAVMQLNEDGGNRKYIMVQWEEATKEDREARKAGYQTIDQISRERIKRAAARIRTEKTDLPENIDLGFKHYYLATPQNQTLEQIIEFDPSQQDLFAHDMIEPFSAKNLGINSKANGIDTLLQTWLINDGYAFNTVVEILNFSGYQAFYIKEVQSLYLISPNFNADCLKELLNQIGTHQLLVNSIILYPYSFSFEELHQLKTNLKTNLDNAPKIIERF